MTIGAVRRFGEQQLLGLYLVAKMTCAMSNASNAGPAAVSPSAADFYRRVLAEVRTRGFSIPLLTIQAPAVMDAMARVRSEPTDDGALMTVTRHRRAQRRRGDGRRARR
jgi:hypothetical protein